MAMAMAMAIIRDMATTAMPMVTVVTTEIMRAMVTMVAETLMPMVMTTATIRAMAITAIVTQMAMAITVMATLMVTATAATAMHRGAAVTTETGQVELTIRAHMLRLVLQICQAPGIRVLVTGLLAQVLIATALRVIAMRATAIRGMVRSMAITPGAATQIYTMAGDVPVSPVRAVAETVATHMEMVAMRSMFVNPVIPAR